MNFDSKITVAELTRIHPSAMNVFIRRKMLCIGCPTETFHTLEDAARNYGIPLEQFLKEIRETINDPRKITRSVKE